MNLQKFSAIKSLMQFFSKTKVNEQAKNNHSVKLKEDFADIDWEAVPAQ